MMNDDAAKAVPIASWSYTLPTTTRLKVYDKGQSNGLSRLSSPFIPRGAGRSYGDAAYITNGITLSSQTLDQIGELDAECGTITCESGVEIIQLHRFLEQTDWAFPIYGGTQWATIGGAVASDIHGKNDVAQGSFGNHVESIVLLLPDGTSLECSRDIRPDLFVATIGGMGLTGFIKAVKLKLQKDLPHMVRMRTKIVSGITQALACFDSSDHDFQFFSCAGCTGQPADGGLYATASYSEGPDAAPRLALEFPVPAINFANLLSWGLGSRTLNIAHRRHYRDIDKRTHIENYNYVGAPAVFKHFNKLCGPLIEYQFVVSADQIQTVFTDLLKLSRARSLAGYGYAMKKFGRVRRMGLLSFPRPGYTVNFFTKDTPEARAFLTYFTDYLLELGGRVYLAKDSCILARQFEAMYDHLDRWREIVRHYDPANRVQSDLSRRLQMKPW